MQHRSALCAIAISGWSGERGEEQDRVADGSLACRVGRHIHHLAAADERRRAASVQVHGLGRPERTHQRGFLGE